MSDVKPIAVKKITVNGQTVECKVLPYIPPTPAEEFDLCWRPKPSTAARRAASIDPWEYVDEMLDHG
jgi:hypothetical protein